MFLSESLSKESLKQLSNNAKHPNKDCTPCFESGAKAYFSPSRFHASASLCGSLTMMTAGPQGTNLVALDLQWGVLLVSSHLFPELLWFWCLSYKVEWPLHRCCCLEYKRKEKVNTETQHSYLIS